MNSRTFERIMDLLRNGGHKIFEGENLTEKRTKKLIREGDYIAEVEVNLLYDETGWSPYLTVEDSLKLDEVRQALRDGQLDKVAAISTLYALTPVFN